MATNINNNTSASSMASNGAVKAYTNRSNFWTGKESFAVVAARTVTGDTQHPGLPTPPNSISPNLPPQAYKKRDIVNPPTPPAHALDSDIDLQDAVDHAKAQDLPQRVLVVTPDDGSSGILEKTGAITPSLLAKHHLPNILLNHGPLAIRHIMGFLTTSLPGFSGIPPAKARRLVVGALEGRGSGGEPGGSHGDVEFEKVGWGRWDARHRGQPSKHDHSVRRSSPTATRHQNHSFRSPSPYASSGIRIPRRANHSRNRVPITTSRTPLTHESLRSLDSDTNMLDPETEADKMSLDDGSGSSSEAPDDGLIADDDLGEVTEEEDWASIGAAALRAGSFPSGGGGKIYTASSHTSRYRKSGGGGPVRRALATSVPTKIGIRPLNMHQQQVQRIQKWQGMSSEHTKENGEFTMDGIGTDSQERDAIQALLSLSSV
ncbi:DNA-binding proteins Bright/BRCAA1/RBP1 and proteins containing BRIGHT domain [Xylographa carneopallida]|nr:DNA-binding proteins Bright/BRCAA1/RBP1 and proteins containing BRIGHT domain [Xylographa carneopallida]